MTNTYGPTLADLPEDQTTPLKLPFTYTGVDCFRPFEVRPGLTTAKRYSVLFTCLTIHAIHLEVANSLDTCSLINALRKFVLRGGQPEELRLDNGGNFVKGEKELHKAVRLSRNGINCKSAIFCYREI